MIDSHLSSQQCPCFPAIIRFATMCVLTHYCDASNKQPEPRATIVSRAVHTSYCISPYIHSRITPSSDRHSADEYERDRSLSDDTSQCLACRRTGATLGAFRQSPRLMYLCLGLQTSSSLWASCAIEVGENQLTRQMAHWRRTAVLCSGLPPIMYVRHRWRHAATERRISCIQSQFRIVLVARLLADLLTTRP